jgi:hypothetical protein
MAEQFRLQNALWQSRAVHLDARLILAGGEVVHDLSKQFLACARFAAQQDRQRPFCLSA